MNIENQVDKKTESEKPSHPTFAGMKIPILSNIHQQILEAITPPEQRLNMNAWHTCGTTHCRAGWAVHLAGKEGYELEKIGGTCFAAMMIFKYSSPIKVSPVRFFEDNETAYRDIKKCATAEKRRNKKTA